MTDPLLFVLAVVAVLATPGPTNTLLMTAGATVGVRRALPLLLAEASGYGVSVFVVGVLIRPAMAMMPHARAVLSVAVGIYLCALAVRLWGRIVGPRVRTVVWREVFVTTLLNPKVLVFAILIHPPGGRSPVSHFATFLGIVPLVGCLWIVFGAVTGELLPDHQYSLIPKLAAAVLACFGVLLIGSSLNG